MFQGGILHFVPKLTLSPPLVYSAFQDMNELIIQVFPCRSTFSTHISSALFNRIMQMLFFFNYFIYLFIYFWLRWVFVSVRGLPLVAASGGHSSSRCAGLSPSRPLLLRSTGSRRAGSVVVAHGPSCSAARGIVPDQGSNPCPLHWQADSQPLRHQGSPQMPFLLAVAADR